MSELDQEQAEVGEQEQAEHVEAPEAVVEDDTDSGQEDYYEPEWLSGGEPEQPRAQPQQQWSQAEIDAYNQYMRQQYQQQPQQQPQGGNVLDEFVKNPDGTISRYAGAAAQQVARAMMEQQLGPLAAQMNEFVAGQARYQASAADDRVRSMYRERFNKDESFVSNKRLQARVDNTIRNLREQAMWQAQRGDPTGFQIFNNPTFPDALLALAKIVEGTKPSSKSGVKAPHMERSSPAAKRQSVELDPDTEAVIARYSQNDPSFRDRYLKSVAEAEKYGDFEF